jgi:hypothetical protein
MNDKRSGGAPDDGDSGSWTTETLPMSVRRELLERELKRLGFRRGSHATSSGDGGGQHQQQPGGGSSSHPQADTGGGEHSE